MNYDTWSQCLFCLGDVGLAANIRTQCFANPFTLTRHMHKQHLQYLPAGQPLTCPTFRALWIDFSLRMSTITEPCSDGTQPRALCIIRNGYYLVGLDGECSYMIVETASPGFSLTLSSEEVC
jgi:hypothetical protein